MAAVTIILRNDIEANWTQGNPILQRYEIALCTDRAYFKVGDGVTHWNDLKIYFDIKEIQELLLQTDSSIEHIEQVRIDMENALKACADIVAEKTGINDFESGRATSYSSAKIEELLGTIEDKNYVIVDTEADRDAIPMADRKTGMLCFCREFDGDEKGMMFQLVGGLDNLCWVVAALGGGSGGGGGGVTVPVIESTFTGNAFPVGEDIVIPYEWYSPNIGRGTVTVLVNNDEFLSEVVSQGNCKAILSGLPSGSYTIRLSIKDRGGLYTDTLSFVIRVGGLELTSTFDPNQEFTITSAIMIPVTVSTISLDPIYITYTVDGTPVRINGVSGYNRIKLDALNVGVHTVTISAESSVYTSNTLEYRLVVADSSALLLVNNGADTMEVMHGNNVEVSYRASMVGQDSFNASYFIDDVRQKNLMIKKGTTIWTVSDLTLGIHTLKVVVSLLDGSDTKEFSVAVTITAAQYTPFEPIVDASLELYLDARDKSNQDITKNIWEDRSDHKRNAELFGYNYNSNGWLDQSLRNNGEAYAKVPYRPLYDDVPTGITIDMMVNIEDAGQQEACVFDLRGASSRRIGVSVNTEKAILTLGSVGITAGFSEGKDTKLTFVVDRTEKMAYIYINGIMSEVVMISAQESISSDSEIYLGCSTAVSGSLTPDMYSNSRVKTVRVYSRPLDYNEVVQNYIADLWNMEDQIAERKKSYENNMPIMYFYGDTSAMTKDNKVPLRIRYVSPNAEKYGESFDLPSCMVGWQGTSSLQYARKNYKLKLKDASGQTFKYNPFNDGVPESTFCLKADYMESSHSHNTGMAKFINDTLYDELVPPQKSSPNIRTTINGFPIMLYVAQSNTAEPVYYGVFNFNLDKSCTDSLGFDKNMYPECMSFEVSANSDTSAGAFRDDSMDSIKTDFELRFPDEDDVTDVEKETYFTNLKRLVSWVKNATEEEFKTNLDQYFNKEFLLKYYIQVLTFGMVDNLGKNMMLTSWDGNIWYPQFYDMDTQLGLDNTGYLEFDSDIDIKAGIYNTSNSKLWNLVASCYADEIAEMYRSMRQKQYTTENIFKYLYDEQINKIGALQYNEDAVAKYITFKNDYLFMLHGNRYEHMKRWISERLLYLDSYFGYEADTSQSITLRANKSGSVYLNITTYSPQYVRVVWKNGVEQKLKVGKNSSGVMIPTRFNGTLATATDQEVVIYNARHIKTIENMAGLNPSIVNVTEARKLVELSIRSCTTLTDVRINSNNKLLRKLDLHGCSALGTASASGASFDLSEAINLVSINLEGTKLTSVILPESGCNVTALALPNSLLSLRLINVNNLKTMTFSPINELSELRIENDGIANKFDIAIFSDKVKSQKYYFKGCMSSTEYLFLNSTRLESFEMYDFPGDNVDVLIFASETELDPHIRKFNVSGTFRQMSVVPASFTTDIEELDLRGCKNIGLGAPTNITTLRISSDCEGLLVGERLSAIFYANLGRYSEVTKVVGKRIQGKRVNKTFYKLSNIVVNDDLPGEINDLSKVLFKKSFRLIKNPCINMYEKEFLINCDFSETKYDGILLGMDTSSTSTWYSRVFDNAPDAYDLVKGYFVERGADMYIFPNMKGTVRISGLCGSGFYTYKSDRSTIYSNIDPIKDSTSTLFGSNINYFYFVGNSTTCKVEIVGDTEIWGSFYQNANINGDMSVKGCLVQIFENAVIHGNVYAENLGKIEDDTFMLKTTTITGKLTIDCSGVPRHIGKGIVMNGNIGEVEVKNAVTDLYFYLYKDFVCQNFIYSNCGCIYCGSEGISNGDYKYKITIDTNILRTIYLLCGYNYNNIPINYLGTFPIIETAKIYLDKNILQNGKNQFILNSENCTKLNISRNKCSLDLVDIRIPNGDLSGEKSGIVSNNVSIQAANILSWSSSGNATIDCAGSVDIFGIDPGVSLTFLTPCTLFRFSGDYNGALSALNSLDEIKYSLNIQNSTEEVLSLNKLKSLNEANILISNNIKVINIPLLENVHTSTSKDYLFILKVGTGYESLSINLPSLKSFVHDPDNTGFLELQYSTLPDQIPIVDIKAPNLLLEDSQKLICSSVSSSSASMNGAPSGIYNLTFKDNSTLGTSFAYKEVLKYSQRVFFGDCNIKIKGSFEYRTNVPTNEISTYDKYIRNLINMLDETSTIEDRIFTVGSNLLSNYPYLADEVVKKGWTIKTVELN